MKSFTANLLSFILHPFLMPTYGILLLFHSFLSVFIPVQSKTPIFVSIFAFTTIIPIIVSLILLKSGKIKDFNIHNKNDRTLPYIICLISYLTCTILLYQIGAPLWILAFLIGSSLSIFLITIINFVWKISAHLSGIGGLVGSIFGITYVLQINPYWLFISVILLSGALAYSRIELKAHTPLQVLAGFLLGVFCLLFSIIFVS